MTKDSGKGITTPISYNYLNLPKTVIHSGGTVNYTYSASGQKLKADFGGGKTYDYVGGLVYDKDGLEFIPTAEGRVLPPGRALTTVAIGASTSIIASNSFYRYEYHLKDHLGNLRAACRCGERQVETTPGDGYEPLVVQEQHYDPFGLDLTGLNSQPGLTASRLKYLDRELQPDLGWYDLQARFYDPSIGRFTTVDPVTENQEEYSTYQYSYNNPITKSDPDGREPCCGEVGDFFAGVGTAWADNQVPVPTTLREVNGRGRNTSAYNAGQNIGDIASLIQGVGEIISGTGGEAAAVVSTVGSGGIAAFAAVPAAVASAGLIVHGGAVVGKASGNLLGQNGRLNASSSEGGQGVEVITKSQIRRHRGIILHLELTLKQGK